MTAIATRPSLPTFEGQDVADAAVKITNAGDGLSEALRVQPKALHMDDVVYYVLRGTVTQVNHRSDKDGDLTRVHTVKADAITEVDEDTATKMLAASADALAKARAELDGQLMLDEENAAAEREAADATDAPTDIAQATAKRVKDGQ